MQKQKKYYVVEVECLIPATVKYRVFVDEGEHAKAIVESEKILPIEPPKLHLSRLKRLSAKLYDWGTNMLRYTKNYR